MKNLFARRKNKNNIKQTTMKDLQRLIDLYSRDIEKEEFTKREVWAYGVVVPLAIIAACLLGSIIEKL
jgi:hypothetical protein